MGALLGLILAGFDYEEIYVFNFSIVISHSELAQLHAFQSA
jgi:hypothetical protein